MEYVSKTHEDHFWVHSRDFWFEIGSFVGRWVSIVYLF